MQNIYRYPQTGQVNSGMFIPTTPQELEVLEWTSVDVIIVTGDSYIDSPFIGAAVVGRVLLDAGYKVGIIAQPSVSTDIDITRLGQPNLFWGVTGGSVDSMVANYTALKKRRKSDDFTPGGINNLRPDRAVIAYTNLIKKYFKSTKPIVLGGIEASLRRVAHYDFWSDKIRRSILFDAKADLLLYGMAEKSTVKLANALRDNDHHKIHTIPGLCYISKKPINKFHLLPDYDVVKKSKRSFSDMFQTFYENNDPLSAKGIIQKQDSRYLVQNPPSPHPTTSELDHFYELEYQNELHPFYSKQGKVKALETIRFSITSHRGCYGECNFCAIAVHQGRTIQSRSEKSIIKEAKRLTKHPSFKGNILDVGGPTANMYGYECSKKMQTGSCKDKRCLSPKICPSLLVNHERQLNLLHKLNNLAGVKNIFIASGLRYDLIQADKKTGLNYMKNLIKNHVSGQLKVAPEHTEDSVLAAMGKPNKDSLLNFKNLFFKLSKKIGKPQFLTYYFIAAHPGCTNEDMIKLKNFCTRELNITPQQTQIFTPTPSTYSTLMYYTGFDHFTKSSIFVEKNGKKKERQKNILISKKHVQRK